MTSSARRLTVAATGERHGWSPSWAPRFICFSSSPGAADRWDDCWAALVACGAAQVEHQIAEDPARKFIELIHSALVSRRAHVGNAHDPVNQPKGASYLGWEHRGDGWVPHGPQIGWRDGDALCLDPESAYGLACRLSTEQGRALGLVLSHALEAARRGKATRPAGRRSLHIPHPNCRPPTPHNCYRPLYHPEIGAFGAIGPGQPVSRGLPSSVARLGAPFIGAKAIIGPPNRATSPTKPPVSARWPDWPRFLNDRHSL